MDNVYSVVHGSTHYYIHLLCYVLHAVQRCNTVHCVPLLLTSENTSSIINCTTIINSLSRGASLGGSDDSSAPDHSQMVAGLTCGDGVPGGQRRVEVERPCGKRRGLDTTAIN